MKEFVETRQLLVFNIMGCFFSHLIREYGLEAFTEEKTDRNKERGRRRYLNSSRKASVNACMKRIIVGSIFHIKATFKRRDIARKDDTSRRRRTSLY